MQTFISWSGERSKAVATALRGFMAQLNPQWGPWLSDVDIEVGKRWRSELSESLRTAAWAIVCVTPASLRSAWVQFETGVLSVSCERICPYLIDMGSDDVRGPLADFQHRKATKQGTWDLAVAINESTMPKLTERTVKTRFASAWPSLEDGIRDAPGDDVASLRDSYNWLDQAGLLNLLRIHFGASANRLTHVFEEALAELDEGTGNLNFDLLVVNATRVIDEGRTLLAPFHCDGVGHVPDFLDECLPPTELKERLRRGLELVVKSNHAKRRRVAAYQLIQEEQSRLLRVIRDRMDARSH
jgi:hypothetical protein